MATIYVLVSENREQVMSDLDTGKIMAWQNREDAENVMACVGDDHGRLHVESREIDD